MKLFKVRYIPTGVFWAGSDYYYGMKFTVSNRTGGKTYDSKKRTISLFKRSLESNNSNIRITKKFALSDFEIVEYQELFTEQMS